MFDPPQGSLSEEPLNTGSGFMWRYCWWDVIFKDTVHRTCRNKCVGLALHQTAQSQNPLKMYRVANESEKSARVNQLIVILFADTIRYAYYRKCTVYLVITGLNRTMYHQQSV